MILSFSLVTPAGVAAQEDVLIVTASTPSGQIQVLPGHCGYVGLLNEGDLQVVTSANGKTKTFSISEGSIECQDGKVVILTDWVRGLS